MFSTMTLCMKAVVNMEDECPLNLDKFHLGVDLFLKAGVGYIKQNNLQFHHFLHCTQAVNSYRSLSLI